MRKHRAAWWCLVGGWSIVVGCGSESDRVASNEGSGGLAGAGADAGRSPDGGTAGCAPGQELLCTCHGVPAGKRICLPDGSGYTPCPACDAGAGGAGGAGEGGPAAGAGGTVDPCAGSAHCADQKLDCGETGVDCGGGCPACPPHVYVEADCIKAARNGSEVCDDAAWKVEAPGTGLVLVCLTDAGGWIYAATNTGPPDPVDGIRRCQGWELNMQNAWDHLSYVERITCNQEQDQIDLDLSGYVGQTLYFGAHEDPSGGGRFTHMCLAWKQ